MFYSLLSCLTCNFPHSAISKKNLASRKWFKPLLSVRHLQTPFCYLLVWHCRDMKRWLFSPVQQLLLHCAGSGTIVKVVVQSIWTILLLVSVFSATCTIHYSIMLSPGKLSHCLFRSWRSALRRCAPCLQYTAVSYGKDKLPILKVNIIQLCGLWITFKHWQ